MTGDKTAFEEMITPEVVKMIRKAGSYRELRDKLDLEQFSLMAKKAGFGGLKTAYKAVKS